MKFEQINGKQRSRRSKSSLTAPAVVEALEVRSLMTVLSPVGTIADATPVISWEAIDGAVSYDLWVSDGEQRTVQLDKKGITVTNYTPTSDLNVGRARAWVRANFAGGIQTPWSTPTDFVVQVAPTVTGPVNALLPDTPQKLAETKPTITWTSPPGAFKFEIFLSDQTRLTSKTITVKNLTPLLDADGNTMPDGNGDVVRQEVRSYTVANDLLMGDYRVFMRTYDDGGRVTDWSSALDFQVATPVTITRPSAPTFQNPPLLEWQAIPGATDYDVVLSKAATPKIRIYDLSFRTGTSYQIPKALANGEYVFWVRAHLRTTGRPETVGIWSAPSNFSTISNPVITGPVGIDSNDPNVRTVTDSRPTVEWTPIDKAGRYDVWVERSDGLKPYLQTTSSTNSYRFEKDIQAGKYSVWVRAVSTTGEMTGWSPEYKFTATGGVPIITFPAQNENVAPIPDITWTPVAEAKTYDIWIAWVGEDYDYIRTSGIALTSFAPTDPLPTGTYRVWVRAVKSDGTALGWSTPVDFTVVSSDVEQTATDFPELLAVLLPTAGDAQADSATDVTAQQAVEPTPEYSPAETDESAVATNTLLPNGESLPVATPEAEYIIQQLAEQCVSGEWWTPQNATT